MRISDWSSDVCSSDLIDGKRGGADRDRHRQRDDHADPGARISNTAPLHAPAPGASTAAGRAFRGDGLGTSGNRISRAPASTVTLTAIVAPCSWTATCIASTSISGLIAAAASAASTASRLRSSDVSPPIVARAASLAICCTLCAMRSEEHTSELQSLMRISYAVFCLKNKKQKT